MSIRVMKVFGICKEQAMLFVSRGAAASLHASCSKRYLCLRPGHDGSLGSFEYLVYENVLRNIAEAAGLQPVFDYEDEQLERMLEPVSSMQTTLLGTLARTPMSTFAGMSALTTE